MNESDITKVYLQDLDKEAVPITKAEEKVIGLEIEQNKQKLLVRCSEYDFFWGYIMNLDEAIDRNSNNLIKFTTRLSLESSEKETKRVKRDFDKLFKTKTVESLAKVCLTTSTIQNILNSIKKLANDVDDVLTSKDMSKRFLEVETDAEFKELRAKCNNLAYKNKLIKKLHTTESRLNQQFRYYLDSNKFLKIHKLGEDKIDEIHRFCLDITGIEQKVSEGRDKLISCNSRLVVSRAKRFLNKGLEFNDLIQEGNLGLIRAVDKYDPAKDVRVATYATWWIDQAIRRAISNKSRTVRIPIHIQEVCNCIYKSMSIMGQKLGRLPTVDEVSEDTGFPSEQIEGILTSALHPVGLTEEISTGVTYEDILADSTSESPLSLTHRGLLRTRIKEVLTVLSERDQIIIRLRYGIGFETPHTLEEIGSKVGLTKTRIRNIQNDALEHFSRDYILGRHRGED